MEDFEKSVLKVATTQEVVVLPRLEDLEKRERTLSLWLAGVGAVVVAFGLGGAFLGSKLLRWHESVDDYVAAKREELNQFTNEKREELRVPIGTISLYGGAVDDETTKKLHDSGWLPCTGDAYPKNREYKALYDTIGTTFGEEGNLFRVPDMAGRVPMGPGDKNGLGAELGNPTVDVRFEHSHGTPAHRHLWYNVGGGGATLSANGGGFHSEGSWRGDNGKPFVLAHSGLEPQKTGGCSTDTSGAGTTRGTHWSSNGSPRKSNIQPSTVVNFMIRFK